MFIAVFSYPVILLILLFPTPGEESYAAYTTKRQRGKILKMFAELVMDVKQKIISIRHIKQMFEKNMVYQTGKQVYDIRKKYNRMVFLYYWSEGRTNDTKIKNMIECQRLNMDIDKLIHMIEENEMKMERRSRVHERMKYVLRTKEETLDEEQKKRAAILRTHMSKLKHNDDQLQVVKKKTYVEDGFDSD